MGAPTGNTAPALTSVTIFFFCFAVLTCVLRVWVKIPKRTLWGVDDAVIGAALLAALANVISTFSAVHQGFGVAWSSLSNVAAVEKALYAGQLLYVISMGLTRISNSLFAARFIVRTQHHVRIASGIVALYVAWTFGSLLTIAIRRPFTSPWHSRDGSQSLFVRWAVIEIIGCGIDITSVAFSAYCVWALQMPVQKKLSVSGIFATRLLILPILAIRLWKLSPTQRPSADKPSIAAEVLTQIAMEVAIILASVTCLTPFLRPFQESGYIPNSSKEGLVSYNITGANRARHDSYFKLGTARSATKNKDGSVMRTATEMELEEVRRQKLARTRLRGDAAENEVACEQNLQTRGETPLEGIRVSRSVNVQH